MIKMPTIKEQANSYTPKAMKNITELQTISTDLVIYHQDIDNEHDFECNYIEVNNLRYRLPDSILKSLKEILKKKPTLKNFSVTKSGEGKQTTYTVIPLD